MLGRQDSAAVGQLKPRILEPQAVDKKPKCSVCIRLIFV